MPRSATALLLLLAGCARDDAQSVEPGAFVPTFAQTTTSLAVTTTTGATSAITMASTGTEDVGGVTLPVMTLTDTASGLPLGMELVADVDGPTVTIGAVRLAEALSGLDVALTLDTPATIAMDAPLGQPRTLDVAGTIALGDPTVPTEGYLPFQIAYTVDDDDATAPAPTGDVPGCRHATFSTTSGPLSVAGEVWTHDVTGFVHAELTSGTWGALSAGMAGYLAHDDVGDVSVLQGEGVVGLSAPSWRMSTWDVAGAFDADKNQHAQMWVEVRWADAERARTHERPPVSELFTAGLGYFPSMLTEAPAGLLHPDDGDGYVWWIAAVDQAAKNDASPSIAYDASVSYTGDGTGGDVHVGGFIRYHKVP